MLANVVLEAGQHECFYTEFALPSWSVMSAILVSSGEIPTDELGVPFRIDGIPPIFSDLLESYHLEDVEREPSGSMFLVVHYCRQY